MNINQLTKKSKAIAALFTFVLVFSVIVMSLAFKASEKVSKAKTTKRANTEFRYTGANTDISSITNVNNWSISDGSETCELGDLPCVVAPDMASITTPSQLVSYLNTLSSSAAQDFVESNATKHRD